ncbi:MAG: GDSL-type esterase/lipase family protein [Bacteroidetes bacterium]|nr:GDSL-type esterase/lipase family protein [Bacteroidota bacterium]
MKQSFLKRHWNIIYLLPLICGVLVILFSLIFNPLLIRKYISVDQNIEPTTVTNIYLVEVFFFLVGLAFLYLSRSLQSYDNSKERKVVDFFIRSAAIIFAVVLVEFGLRKINQIKPFNRDRHAFFQYDEVLGWKHLPGKTTSLKNTLVRINSKGLRDDEFPEKKPTGEYRILFLGDSQLFGDGVEAKDTFVSILESSLSSMQAINAGVIGYGTDQQLLYLQREGLNYEPDLVIVALNVYDFQDNVSKKIRSGYSKPVFKIQNDALQLTGIPVQRFDIIERLGKYMRNNYQTYYLSSEYFRGLFNNAEVNAQENQHNLSSELLAIFDQKNVQTVTQRILKEIAWQSRKVGVQTAVIFLPYQIYFNSSLEYKRKIDEVSQNLQAYGMQNGFFFVDLHPELNNIPVSDVFLDEMHFNKKGNTIVANIIAEKLLSIVDVPVSVTNRF